MSKLTIEGIEWHYLLDLTTQMLNLDDNLRENHKKTIFRHRHRVETAKDELVRAVKGSKKWVHHIEIDYGGNHNKRTIFITSDSRGLDMSLSPCERLVFSAPKQVRINATQDVLVGMADVCCKAQGLNGAYSKNDKFLADTEIEFLKQIWSRCHLFYRRSVGGMKGAWRKKGYIAEYKEMPDLRDSKFHEGSKLFYDLKELKEST